MGCSFLNHLVPSSQLLLLHSAVLCLHICYITNHYRLLSKSRGPSPTITCLIYLNQTVLVDIYNGMASMLLLKRNTCFFSLPTLFCVQCSLLSWYHVTASSIHSTACWSNSAISLTMNHTCHWTQPFQSPFNSRTVGVAVVTPGEAALSPSLPILHILHLQPAVVLTPIPLPAQGHPVHSNFQVFSFSFPTNNK